MYNSNWGLARVLTPYSRAGGPPSATIGGGRGQISLDLYYYFVSAFGGAEDNSVTNKINVLLSGVHKELPELSLNTKFIEWFVGLCEAESRAEP